MISLRATILVLSLFVFAQCTSSKNTSLKVFVAASLTESFQDIARAFEKTYPNHKVDLVFAGSQALRVQIENGAPADIYVSAHRKHIDALLKKTLIQNTTQFAENKLALAVPPDNPSQLKELLDLPRAKHIVIGAEEVPIGIYTHKLLTKVEAEHPGFKQKVEARIVSKELSVRQVAVKVAIGAADAAIVFRTDILAQKDKLREIKIDDRYNLKTLYFISKVKRSQSKTSTDFIRFIQSRHAQTILRVRGFGLSKKKES